MFDDEADDVGQEIEAFCARCKTDTPHTVVSRYEEDIRRVRCNTCDDVHAFRRPRGEDGEEPPEQPVRKKVAKAKPTWEQVINKRKSTPRPWGPDEVFCELDVIAHTVFGIGFVSELIGQDKVEITFQNDKRILIHNRKRLPLHMVQRQRQEAEARARADGKAKAKEAREAKAAAKEAAKLVKTHDAELDDMDLPEILADEDEFPVVRSSKAGQASKSTRLSARELAALDDEDDDFPSEHGEDDSDSPSRQSKAKNGSAGRKKAEKSAVSSGSKKAWDEDVAVGEDKKRARKQPTLKSHAKEGPAEAKAVPVDEAKPTSGKRGRKPKALAPSSPPVRAAKSVPEQAATKDKAIARKPGRKAAAAPAGKTAEVGAEVSAIHTETEKTVSVAANVAVVPDSKRGRGKKTETGAAAASAPEVVAEKPSRKRKPSAEVFASEPTAKPDHAKRGRKPKKDPSPAETPQTGSEGSVAKLAAPDEAPDRPGRKKKAESAQGKTAKAEVSKTVETVASEGGRKKAAKPARETKAKKSAVEEVAKSSVSVPVPVPVEAKAPPKTKPSRRRSG